MTPVNDDTCEARQNGLRTQIERNTQNIAELWKAIDALRNRPPVWATAVIGALCAACGWMARVAFT